jgi:hypothetical protein
MKVANNKVVRCIGWIQLGHNWFTEGSLMNSDYGGTEEPMYY